MISAARPDVGWREQQAVARVLASGGLAQGTEVAAFEQEFSALASDGRFAVAVNSGTSALHLLLVALGIGPHDEVIVPSFTFAATANCVAFTGATPVFVDVNLDDYTVNVDAVRSAIGPRTRAVIPVHLYGHPANMGELARICLSADLLLLEDAAQAHMAKWSGKFVGTWGAGGTFSFYPTKNMTSGEGGMVVTSDAEAARTVRLLRNQGQERRYENEIVGLNNRMTDIHAAIGRVQLASLPERTERRRENAAFFNAHLQGVVKPSEHPQALHVYHQYTIRVEGHERDRFAEELTKKLVGTGVYYPTPVHRLPAFSSAIDLPNTDHAARSVLSLPVYPSLSDDERERVVQAVNSVASAGV